MIQYFFRAAPTVAAHKMKQVEPADEEDEEDLEEEEDGEEVTPHHLAKTPAHAK